MGMGGDDEENESGHHGHHSHRRAHGSSLSYALSCQECRAVKKWTAPKSSSIVSVLALHSKSNQIVGMGGDDESGHGGHHSHRRAHGSSLSYVLSCQECIVVLKNESQASNFV